MTVPSHQAGPSSASAAPLITPVIRLSDCWAASSTASVQAVTQVSAQRRVQRAAQRLVVGRQHTVLAVVAAELGQKSHRLLGALGDQFAVHPVQRLGESGSLAVHFGREQVAHRDVEGEPVGVEPVDEIRLAAGEAVRREGVAQHPQCVSVI